MVRAALLGLIDYGSYRETLTWHRRHRLLLDELARQSSFQLGSFNLQIELLGIAAGLFSPEMESNLRRGFGSLFLSTQRMLSPWVTEEHIQEQEAREGRRLVDEYERKFPGYQDKADKVAEALWNRQRTTGPVRSTIYNKHTAENMEVART